jgi:hypothetical protein
MDYIYNSLVWRHEAKTQSLWCAYTNQADVQNPRWPADDDYMDNQYAWVWWGPIDLRRAVSAAVVFNLSSILISRGQSFLPGNEADSTRGKRDEGVQDVGPSLGNKRGKGS